MFPRFRDCFRVNLTAALGGTPSRPGLRNISSSEIATALRPFYFVVHPDLFGRHPEQRSVNEESLKQLSAHIEALQQRRMTHSTPRALRFYIRDSDSNSRDTFKLINITLERSSDTKVIIKRILESCNLPTDYVDKIKTKPEDVGSQNFSRFYDTSQYTQGKPFGDINWNNTSEFADFELRFRKKKEEDKKTLKTFLEKNVELAKERNKDLEELQEEVSKLQKIVVERLQLKDIRYDCGWNFEHYRGCLKSLERLANLHEKEMDVLRGRIVVFAEFTGVSLEGHIMLFTGDVLNSWLDFIKNIPKQDLFLKKIPAYEVALSQVLRNIKIGRRKFMPKAQASMYAGHLTKVTTSLLDYLSKQKYPKSWPDNLSDYEIVIESEAGPLMVSPTGQFIAPATCPGSILVDFLTTHLEEAKQKGVEYSRNKHIERELHKRCVDELRLKSLTKDDSVTPEKMIKTLEKLVSSKLYKLTDVHLNITNYYSVLQDGTMCIPWDYYTME